MEVSKGSKLFLSLFKHAMLALGCMLISNLVYSQELDIIEPAHPILKFYEVILEKQDSSQLKVRYYDQSKRKRLEVPYCNGQKEGMQHTWDGHGVLRAKEPFKSGKRHGTIKQFHPNGKIAWKKGYRNGKLHGRRICTDSLGTPCQGAVHDEFVTQGGYVESTCVNGIPEGEYCVFRADSTVYSKGMYLNGAPHGEALYFDEEGIMTKVETYHQGRFVTSRVIE